jgi:hypothetical protein
LHEPVERPRAAGRQTLDVNPAGAAFLERERSACPNEVRGKLAETGLMSDKRDPPPLR